MIYVFLREDILLSLCGTVIVWATQTRNSNQQSSYWVHERGYVMNSHCIGYTNVNQLSCSFLLYDRTVQQSTSPKLYSVPYLVC